MGGGIPPVRQASDGMAGAGMVKTPSAPLGAHSGYSGSNANPRMPPQVPGSRSNELRRKYVVDFEVLRAADAMMHQFGDHAELQAARYADLMLGHSNRAGLLVWARIWRMIAEKRPAQTGLPH